MGDVFEQTLGDVERLGDAGDAQAAHVRFATVDKGLYIGFRAGFANKGGDIEGKKVGGFYEGSYRTHVDVVGVHEVFTLEAQGGYSGIGFLADIGRVGVNNLVFTVGLVPYGTDVEAGLVGLDGGPELGNALVGKTVTRSDAEFG